VANAMAISRSLCMVGFNGQWWSLGGGRYRLCSAVIRTR
jgi:hypothetical protein